ncbi:MAG: hypothetical protein F4Y57_04375 [Acidobacteria bacterium]|nr:hypothetical protein [Acidobacteriota bacterium]
MLSIDVAILLAAFGAGLSTAPAGVIELQNLPQDDGEMAATALLVAMRNLQALTASLLLGLCSGGLYSVVVLGWNGWAFGRVLPALVRTSPAAALFALTYVPAEFVAMLLGCLSVQHVLLSACRWLVENERIEFDRPLRAAALAVGLLLIGAWLEADAGRRIHGLLG